MFFCVLSAGHFLPVCIHQICSSLHQCQLTLTLDRIVSIKIAIKIAEEKLKIKNKSKVESPVFDYITNFVLRMLKRNVQKPTSRFRLFYHFKPIKCYFAECVSSCPHFFSDFIKNATSVWGFCNFCVCIRRDFQKFKE